MNTASPAPNAAWRRAAVALALLELALIGLYVGTAQGMVDIWWRSGTFNHAFLVPPISLWLIWEKRHELAALAPRPAWWLALPFAALGFAWLLGELAAVNVVTQLAFVALLVLAVPLVVGLPAALRITFPLAFLFFAVPIGEFLLPRLMDWTAYFTVLGLRASGIPVLQEGLHFVIPSGRWSVVEACSGVRYLIASLVVGTLYAYLNYHSLKRRLIFVAVSIAVPLVANWLRAYMIVMLGHLSGNQLATGVDHLIYGWLFFGLVMAIVFAVGLRWREHELPPPRAGTLPAAPASSSGVLPAALLALAIGLLPPVAMQWMEHAASASSPVLSAAPLAGEGWQISETPVAAWRPAYQNPSATLATSLEKEGQRIGVFIAYYRQQGYQRKLISSENVLAKSGDREWALAGGGLRDLTLAGQPVTLRVGRLRSHVASVGTDPVRLQVWHGYWIGGQWLTSDHLGKLRLALSRLTGQGDDSAAVFVYAPEGEVEAGTVLADYLANAGSGIETLLRQTQSSQ